MNLVVVASVLDGGFAKADIHKGHQSVDGQAERPGTIIKALGILGGGKVAVDRVLGGHG